MFFTEVITNIQCSILSIGMFLKYTRACKKVFPTTMLASLVNHTNLATAVNMEVISNIKCQIRNLYLEEFFIKYSYDNICQHLC